MPACPMERKDCAACNREGRCRALDRADFPGRPCPFYKTWEQQKAENGAAWERLVALGRYDLLATYRPKEFHKTQKEEKNHV